MQTTAASTHPAFDVVVIGGGPAGLVAATYLARFRRTVCVVDAGRSRLAKIPRSHNYPGFAEGIAGPQLLLNLREQVARYPIVVEAGDAHRLTHCADGFRIEWSGGEARARSVLLATGASDVEPTMPHVAEAVRNGALRYCPVCDGFEVVGQEVGVIADGPAGVREALYLRDFTDRLTVFLQQGAEAIGDDERLRMREAGIRWVDEPIRSIRVWNGRVTISHRDGESSCDSVYCALGMKVHSDLALQLAARVDDSGYLQVDAHQRTSVPSLYAAGDVASGLNQISVAVGAAAIAAAAIHQQLRTR